MSSEKHETVDIEPVLICFKNYFGVKTDKDLAEILGISANDLNNRKRRGTLINLFFNWAIQNKLDLNKLFYPSETERQKIEYLEDVEQWLKFLLNKEPERIHWFAFQFEDSFKGFKEWKAARGKTLEENAEVKKLANGGGWK